MKSHNPTRIPELQISPELTSLWRPAWKWIGLILTCINIAHTCTAYKQTKWSEACFTCKIFGTFITHSSTRPGFLRHRVESEWWRELDWTNQKSTVSVSTWTLGSQWSRRGCRRCRPECHPQSAPVLCLASAPTSTDHCFRLYNSITWHCHFCFTVVSDIAIFVLKGDVKL